MSDGAGFDDELVSSFMSVTGIADTTQANSYLEMAGGNLDMAVSLYMEHGGGSGGGGVGGGGGGGGHSSSGSRGGRSGGGDINGMAGMGMSDDFGGYGGMGASAMMGEADIRAPDQTRTEALLPSDAVPHAAYSSMMAMMEEQLAQHAFASVPSGFDARAMANDAAAAAAAIATDAGVSSRRGASAGVDSKSDDNDDDEDHVASGAGGKENGYQDDDDDDDDDDIEIIGGSNPLAPARLSDMFAPPSHLMHKAGGFQGARAVAKDSKRWLLVNLQRDSEFSCHALNRDVWRDELVENLVREGFIFWQTMDITPEGRTYAERYGVHDYPHLAIIDPRTGRLLWRKEGWTQENPVTKEVFAEIAMDFCSRNSFDRPPSAPAPRPPSTNANGGTKRPMHEMSEDEQLQAAMQASLEDSTQGGAGHASKDSDNDDAKMEVDDEDVEVLDRGDSKQSASIDATAVADTAAPSPPEEKPPSFIDELLAMNIGEEPASGARIQFRTPDGKRIVRKFLPSDTVKIIYAHLAQSNEEARSGREFSLMAGFPPRDLLANIDETIEACKLSGESINLRWK